MSGALDYPELAGLLNGRPKADAICPACTPHRQKRHQREAKLRLWALDRAVSFFCAHCEERGIVFADDEARCQFEPAELARLKELREAEHEKEVAKRRELARWLYGKARPVTLTLGENYYRFHRAIEWSPLPATMRFLPATTEHPPAILMPFQRPGGEVMGIHLTRLQANGDKLPDRAKIMIGRDFGGHPLVMAEIPDSGILAICEGPENALTMHEAMGWGAWAAGAKGLLKPLATAVPAAIERVWVVPDHDPDRGGLRAAEELVTALKKLGLRAGLLDLGGSDD